MKTNVLVWVVVYRPSAEVGWMMKRDLTGPGHATDLVTQMLDGGCAAALATRISVAVEVPDLPQAEEAEKVPPQATDKPAKQGVKKAKDK